MEKTQIQILLCVALIVLQLCRTLYSWKKNKKQEKIVSSLPAFERIESLYKSVKKPIHSRDEKPVRINQVYVYPIKGIRSPKPVKELWLGAYGVKYDRELVLVSPEDGNKVGHNNYKPLCCLSQELRGNKVHITTNEPEKLGSRPKELVISLDDKQFEGQLFQNKYHAGYVLSDDINDWFTAAIGKKVVAVHTPYTYQQDLDPKRLLLKEKNDTRKGYARDAALHMINVASVDDLRKRVWAKYPQITNPEDKVWVDVEQFRPNFVIDTGKAYEEDCFCEMRLESCLLRTPGPSVRCGVTRTHFDKKQFCPEFEPMSTLKTYRNIESLGNIFGMYYQMDVLNEENYDKVLPKSQGYKAYDKSVSERNVEYRKADNTWYVKVKEGDMFQVRCIEKRDWISRLGCKKEE